MVTSVISHAIALEGEAAAATAAQQGGIGSLLSTLAIPVLLIAVFYFIAIRPQKKQEKETANMRDNLMVGDEITTIGGIAGRVVNIREDMLVIETGSDRTKIKIARWAVRSVEKKVGGEAEEKKPASFKLKK